jgi:hypothetical protein
MATGLGQALLISANATNLDIFVIGRVVQELSKAVELSQVFVVLWVFAPSRLFNQAGALVAGVSAVGMAEFASTNASH